VITVTVLLDGPADPWHDACLRSLASIPDTDIRPRTGAEAEDHAVPSGVIIDLRAGGTPPAPGAWRVLRDDGHPFGAPHLFAEVFGRPDRLASVLVVDGHNTVLRRADLSSVGRRLTRLRATAGRLAVAMLGAALRNHIAGIELPRPIFEAPRPRRPFGVAARLGGQVRHGIATLRQAAYTEFWHIGILDAPISSVLETPTPRGVRWVKAPAGTIYHADPFARPETQDEIWCERYDYATRHGVLERTRLTGDHLESLGDLEAPVHRSYPFMTHLGDTPTGTASLLVPEACAGGQTTLYRLNQDGTLGDPVAVLPVPGIDPVLFWWHGRLWLALTRADLDNRSNLCVWHAPTPAGPWTPHTGNPVKLDVRSSRGGGTPFVHDGVLYRPAQDCSRTYGGRVVVNRVLELTPTRFREEVAVVVSPAPDWPAPHGLHTLSAFGDRTLLDAKREVPSLAAAAVRIRARVARR